jgi:hypothetical protein
MGEGSRRQNVMCCCTMLGCTVRGLARVSLAAVLQLASDGAI